MGLRDRIAAAPLTMPLRDLRRGLMEAGRLPRDLFRPLVRPSDQAAAGTALPRALPRALPGPAREALALLRDAARRAEGRVFDADAPVPGEIARAAGALRTAGRASDRTLARVVSFAIERVLADLPRARLLVSETVAAAVLAALPSRQGDGADRAARIALALLAGHAVGPVPGTPVPIAAEDRPVAMHAVHAALLWLLAERPDAGSDEPALLELCLRLTEGMAGEIDGAFASADRLAAELRALAAVV